MEEAEFLNTVESWLIIILGGGGALFLAWMNGWIGKKNKKSD